MLAGMLILVQFFFHDQRHSTSHLWRLRTSKTVSRVLKTLKDKPSDRGQGAGGRGQGAGGRDLKRQGMTGNLSPHK